MAKTFRIYDELYGYIRLSESEKVIVDTSVFQRLRRVKQLSLASLVYPGAEHTRFSHSIGVAYNVQLIGSKLKKQGYLSEDELMVARAAALVHDIGHLPFSHALEYAYHYRYGSGDYKLHEEVTLAVVRGNPELREALWFSGIDPEEVARVIEGRHRNPLLTTLLSGDLDADRLDYLPRDALHTGVAYGLIDRERLIDTITVDSTGRLALYYKGVEALENFYVARLHMYRAVYYHKTVTAYTLLLSRLFEALAEEDPEVGEVFTKDGLMKAARTEEFAFLDDSWLTSKIALAARSRRSRLAELARSFLFRRGPKLVYERVTVNGVSKDEVEDAVKKLSHCVPSDAIYVYLDKVRVKDASRPLTIVYRDREASINDAEVSPIISRLPNEITLFRIYVEPRYTRKAMDCARRIK